MMTSDYTPSPFMKRGYVIMGMVLLMSVCAALSVNADDAVTLTIETKGSYTLVAGDSIQLAQELPKFYAIREAAEKAADKFVQHGLIQFVDRDKNELVNLLADSLGAELLEDQCTEDGNSVTCSVRARTVVMLSDFIEAQLVSLRLGAQEDKEDYLHEMEPQVQTPLRPGLALAKAYRLLRKQELRMAIIYLDRLADAYPNWWEIFELKAIAFRLSNQPEKMLEALRKACTLGSPTACAEPI
jgi:tetratricopeptide (TPR) repeat protein